MSNQNLLHSVTPRRMRVVCPKIEVGSKGVGLVVVWAFLLYASFILFSQLSVSEGLLSYVGCGVVILFGPIAGLLASAYYGRYKTVYTSIWIMWIGVVSITVTEVLKGLLPDTGNTWARYVSVVAEVVSLTGFTAFSVNSIPFGLDQMPDASGSRISAFVHWYVWSGFAGTFVAMLPYNIHTCVPFPNLSIIQSLAYTIPITLMLCSAFLLHGWFIVEPAGPNPLTTVYLVLKFAAKHRIPIQRSAFTYCEDEVPTGLDLGKSKYGGPFSTEQVEDVKTCLRMSLVIGSSSVMFSSIIIFCHLLYITVSTMLTYSSHSECRDLLLQVGTYIIFFVLLMLPVYNVVVYPLCSRCIPSTTLRRVSLAQAMHTFANLIPLVISIVWYVSYHTYHKRMHVSSDDLPQLPLEHAWIYMPTSGFVSCVLFFFFTALLDFVCAQAPYNFRGLLIGLVYSVALLSSAVGVMVYSIWVAAYEDQSSNTPRCRLLFAIFTVVISILGCVLWCAVTRRYKNRVRDEPDRVREFAENYYSR